MQRSPYHDKQKIAYLFIFIHPSIHPIYYSICLFFPSIFPSFISSINSVSQPIDDRCKYPKRRLDAFTLTSGPVGPVLLSPRRFPQCRWFPAGQQLYGNRRVDRPPHVSQHLQHPFFSDDHRRPRSPSAAPAPRHPQQLHAHATLSNFVLNFYLPSLLCYFF